MAFNLKRFYDALTKAQGLTNAAQKLLNIGGQTDDEKAVTLLTAACELNTTILPEGKLGLAFQIGLDISQAQNEEDFCTSAPPTAISAFQSALTSALNYFDSQSIDFSNTMQSNLYYSENAFISTGNTQGFIATADQALSIPSLDGSTTVLTGNTFQITYQITDPSQDVKSLTVLENQNWEINFLDQENDDGTSILTTVNPDGSSTTIHFTGPDGTGTVTETDYQDPQGDTEVVAVPDDQTLTLPQSSQDIPNITLGNESTLNLGSTPFSGIIRSSGISIITVDGYWNLEITPGDYPIAMVFNVNDQSDEFQIEGVSGGYGIGGIAQVGTSAKTDLSTIIPGLGYAAIGWKFDLQDNIVSTTIVVNPTPFSYFINNQTLTLGGEYVHENYNINEAANELNYYATYASDLAITTLSIVGTGGSYSTLTEQVNIENLQINGVPNGDQNELSLANGAINASSVSIAANTAIEGFGSIGTSSDPSSIVDNGVLNASGGALQLTGNVDGTGLLEVAANSAIVLDGSLNSQSGDQVVTEFLGDGGSLSITGAGNNEVFIGNNGTPCGGIISGGTGFNSIVYSIPIETGTITDAADGNLTVSDPVDGTYSLYNFNEVQFSDATVYLYNPSGQPYYAYYYTFSAGNDFVGSDFFYTATAGQAYAGYEYDYHGGGNPTRVAFTGVTGAAYSSYEYDYVGGVYAGAKFEFTTVPAGASYSSYETDYNAVTGFTGDKFFFTDIAGQSYTGEEEDFNAMGQLTRVLLSGVTGQSYEALEEDYSGGSYAGYKAYYAITGQTYSGEEVDVSAANALTRVVYTGLTGTPYSSVAEDFANGALTDTVYDFTNPTGQSFYAYQATDDASGNALQETVDNNDGSHTIVGFQADQTFTSSGDDSFTGGAGNQTFVFNPVFGHDTITDFSSYLSGAGHDTISLASAEFASFAAVLAAAQNVNGNAVITATNGDSLTLNNTTTSALAANAGDFTFHS